MKKYNVILADAPWDMKAGKGFNEEDNTSRDLAYPTMTVDEIASMRVCDIANDHSHLYFWVTNKYLPDAFGIVKAWGFKYSTMLTWCKASFGGGGLGGTFKITTEHLLFCRRGSLKSLRQWPTTHFTVKRQYENGHPKHSKKPYFFHQLIEQTSPGNRIELFAREQRGSWDVWGNETKQEFNLLTEAGDVSSNDQKLTHKKWTH